MGTMESEQFFLKWNNFENNLTSGFADLLQQEAMVDVTLAAEGKIIQAHKVILSICSSYFRSMFQLTPCQHPIVVLKDVGYQELMDMLDFMYKGEANVRQEDLPSFLKLAETLKVKGLAGTSTESEEEIKKGSDFQASNSAKENFPAEKEDFSNELSDEENNSRKKRKRPASPHKNSALKSFPCSDTIKLELNELENRFAENNVQKSDDGVLVKGERLTEDGFNLCEYNSAGLSRNGKDPGPSSMEESCEAVPQGIRFQFNPKRVPIWDFYRVSEEHEMAMCKVCRKIIKTRKKDGTRNVLSHMRNLHPEKYELALRFKEIWKIMKRRKRFDLNETVFDLEPFSPTGSGPKIGGI